MIHYFQVDSTGLIIAYGSCYVEADLPSPDLGEVFLQAPEPGATHYINGQFQTLPNLADIERSVREARNYALMMTDYTQLPDNTLDKDAWATYRQALRDITDQPGFPADVVWPTPPGA